MREYRVYCAQLAFSAGPCENSHYRRYIPLSKIDWTQFNEKQIQAIHMLSLPNRGGLGFDEISEKCGVSTRQLHRWRNKEAFKKAIMEQSLLHVKDELPDVIQNHIRMAKKGNNVKAVELYYRLIGVLVDKQEITQEVTNHERDNAALERELDDLKRLLDEEKGAVM